MKAEISKAIRKVIADWLEAYGNEWSCGISEKAQLYLKGLGDLPDPELLDRAFLVGLQTSRFFPRVEEIRRAYFEAAAERPRVSKVRADCERCGGSGWQVNDGLARRCELCAEAK